MISGIDVILHELTKVSEDDFGQPVYEENTVTISNVLVSPVDASEVSSALELYGKRTAYQLGIPKGDTHTWEDNIVEFFGKKFRTFGSVEQGIEENIPSAIPWHHKIKVEIYE